MPRIKSTLASFLLGLALLSAKAEAQCPIPDNLDGGPCCTPTFLRLPRFPGFTQQSLDICWQNCAASQVIGVTATWTPPVPPPQPFPGPPPCNIFVSGVTIFNVPGVVAWRGTLRLQYSRTWMETTPGGGMMQVWRFLVNGELNPTAAAGPVPCPVPNCAAAFNNRVRWTGYIDYAQNCLSLLWSQAWMLNHDCDFIDHAPGFPRGGVFHPGRSYTFVGPAAGFVVGAPIAIETGPIGFEAVRRVNLPILGAVANCEFEEPIIGGNLNPVLPFCPCTTGPAVAQYVQSNLVLGGTCGTIVNTPGGPFLPGFISKAIGTWTFAATFPGVEELRWNCGDYSYTDPCTGVVQPEIFFGVSTRGGFPANQLLTVGGIGALLPPHFVDQSNSLGNPAFTTTMNIQYVSNHILNMNLP